MLRDCTIVCTNADESNKFIILYFYPNLPMQKFAYITFGKHVVVYIVMSFKILL